MPQGNGTGPVGTGPKTGRGAGHCAGNNAQGWQAPGASAGMQRGFRRNGKPRGFFRNHAQHAVAADAMVLQEKIDAMRAQLTSLEQQLESITVKNED